MFCDDLEYGVYGILGKLTSQDELCEESISATVESDTIFEPTVMTCVVVNVVLVVHDKRKIGFWCLPMPRGRVQGAVVDLHSAAAAAKHREYHRTRACR